MDAQPSNDVDQNGHAACGLSELGDRSQIYRLSNETIYSYWDSAPYDNRPNNPTAQSFVAGNS